MGMRLKHLWEDGDPATQAEQGAATPGQDADFAGNFWTALERFGRKVGTITVDDFRNKADEILQTADAVFTPLSNEPIVARWLRSLKYAIERGDIGLFNKTVESAKRIYNNPFVPHQGSDFYVYREKGSKPFGPYTRSQIVQLMRGRRLVKGDVIYDKTKNASKVYAGEPSKAAPKGEGDQRVLRTKDVQFTSDAEAWEFVHKLADDILNRYYYASGATITPKDMSRVLTQVAAIKKAATKWLNNRSEREAQPSEAASAAASESRTKAVNAINELHAVSGYLDSMLAEYGMNNTARRQARLLRLQTRQVLDALRDDNKEEIAQGPFLDTKRAEEEGARDKDKDK
jgi:hypothetical protein